MKFISKNPTLRVVLSPGLEGNRFTGEAARPGLYVKFEDGVAVIDDEGMQKKMLAHPGFNQDYIVVKDSEIDPYAGQRRSLEQTHDLIELEYGHVKRNLNPKGPSISPEARKLATELAKEMALEIAPKLAESMVKKAIEELGVNNNAPANEGKAKKGSSTRKTARKVGRPSKKEIEARKKAEAEAEAIDSAEDTPETL